jgi:hypothetical protein
MITVKNPFYVRSPEGMPAEDVRSLFVEAFSDYPSILEEAHIFIVGPRGTGKSMMFRYMMPDCQYGHIAEESLPFFATYIPLKRQNFNIAELARLENAHANVIINEHLLTAFVARRFFDQVLCSIESGILKLGSFPEIVACFDLIGSAAPATDNPVKLIEALRQEWSSFYDEAIKYLNSIAFSGPLPFSSRLVNYLDHLLPTLNSFRESTIFTKIPIFLLLDDAHNLSHTQTQILNGWISTRTASEVALKISTQPNYKTYFTTIGDRIETPHDYSETRTAEIYTTKSKGNYYKRISEIVSLRLKMSDLDGDPHEFFPPDLEQEKAIEVIATALRAAHDRGEGRGARASDDASRYARPNYIREQAGTSKNSSKYSYSGFDQLVHVSAGITRHFLECASKMFDHVIASGGGTTISSISPSIQDAIIREEADELKFRLTGREGNDSDPRAFSEEEMARVRNLIDCLGGAFRTILLSERSERRVYSIAFSDEPSSELRAALSMAVNLGFLSEGSIGKKSSVVGGRTRLYILTRRLAPHWTLDPTGFAGYLFISARKLEVGLERPETFLTQFQKDNQAGEMHVEQLELF